MPDCSRKRPRDASQLAKMIVDIASGEKVEELVAMVEASLPKPGPRGPYKKRQPQS